MDRKTGEIHWQFTMPDARYLLNPSAYIYIYLILTHSSSSLVIHSKIVLTPSALYLVGVAKSIESYTLHITTLVPTTGELITSANIPSSISDAVQSFFVLSNGISENNQIAWLEKGSLKHVALVPKLNAKPTAIKNAEFEGLVDIGLTDNGHIIALKKDGVARVLKLVEHGVKSVYEFKDEVSFSYHHTFHPFIV